MYVYLYIKSNTSFNTFGTMWSTVGSRYILTREMRKKLILSLFISKQKATASPAFMPPSPILQSFYYVDECFSLKQSRQKRTSHNQNRRFYFFFAVAEFSCSSQHSIFRHRARIRKKNLEISFSYLGNSTYNMKINEKVTWAIIQLVGKNDWLCGNTRKKTINNP